MFLATVNSASILEDLRQSSVKFFERYQILFVFWTFKGSIERSIEQYVFCKWNTQSRWCLYAGIFVSNRFLVAILLILSQVFLIEKLCLGYSGWCKVRRAQRRLFRSNIQRQGFKRVVTSTVRIDRPHRPSATGRSLLVSHWILNRSLPTKNCRRGERLSIWIYQSIWLSMFITVIKLEFSNSIPRNLVLTLEKTF